MAWQPGLSYAAVCMMSAAQQKRNAALSAALSNQYRISQGLLGCQDPQAKPEIQDKHDENADRITENTDHHSNPGSTRSTPSPICIAPIPADTSSTDQCGIDMSAGKDSNTNNTDSDEDADTLQRDVPLNSKSSDTQPQKPEQKQEDKPAKPVIKFSIDDILGRATAKTVSARPSVHHGVLGGSRASSSIPAIPVPTFLGHMPTAPPPGVPRCPSHFGPPRSFPLKRPCEDPGEEEDEEDEEIDVDSEDSTVFCVRDAEDGQEDDAAKADAEKYSWLQCTRYKPPKLPRSKKKEGVKKRKLGRNPRVPFTQHQVSVLEQKFRQTHYLSSVDVAELSAALNLTETRVKIWFQNRRARERRDKDSSTLGLSEGEKQTTSPSPATEPHQPPAGLPPGPPHPLYFNPMWPMYPLDPRAAHALSGQGILGNGRPSAFTPVTFRRYV